LSLRSQQPHIVKTVQSASGFRDALKHPSLRSRGPGRLCGPG